MQTLLIRFSGELTCGGPWISLFPEAVLPPKGTEARDAMEADMEPGMIKDRRQELVIIGSDLNKKAITEALDACLLKKEENVVAEDNTDGCNVDPEDFKKNGWKFGWKPDEVCLPPWPPVEEALEGFEEDDDGECPLFEEDDKSSTPSR